MPALPRGVYFFSLADPDALGQARYQRSAFSGRGKECGRGILYSKKAGFLDLAHVRDTMDWSYFVSQRLEEALHKGEQTVAIPRSADSVFQLTLAYPQNWKRLPVVDRQETVREASIEIAHYVVFHLMTWHEIATWFGYGRSWIWTEKPSAFTYDDTMSHVVGWRAADLALRNTTGNWDRDATRGLEMALAEVEVVSKAEAAAAVTSVENRWWRRGVCLKRMIDIGEREGMIYPWLVAAPEGVERPQAFAVPEPPVGLPSLNCLTVRPSPKLLARIRESCPLPDASIDIRATYSLLLETIRYEVKKELGPYADQMD
jgi:hypothetical protein